MALISLLDYRPIQFTKNVVVIQMYVIFIGIGSRAYPDIVRETRLCYGSKIT